MTVPGPSGRSSGEVGPSGRSSGEVGPSGRSSGEVGPSSRSSGAVDRTPGDEVEERGDGFDWHPVRGGGRLPLVVLLALFLTVTVLVERQDGEPGAPPAFAATVQPMADPPSGTSSIWYCAAGTARGSAEARGSDIVAEQTVIMTNAGTVARRARVTAYPDRGDPVTREVALPAQERVDLVVADLVRADFASALVEVDGGAVAVAHRVVGPAGESTGACASAASRTWYFAAGSTMGTGRQVLVLFNPFPQQVAVDIRFQVEEDGGRQGGRDPQRLVGLVVPAGRTLAVDITDDVVLRRQISTRIESRDPTARLVADRLLVGAGGAFERPYLSVALGSPAVRSGWVFADGRPRRTDLDTTFVLYNPAGETVEVELRLRQDRVAAPIEPFRVAVRTGQYQVITLDDRVADESGYWAALVARSNGTFVAERVVRAKPVPEVPGRPPPLAPSLFDAAGTTYTAGSAVLAGEWIVPDASAEGGAGVVAVANLGTGPVNLSMSVVAEGRETTLAGYENVVLDPGLRTSVDLADPSLRGAGRRSLRVRADGPVVTEVSVAPRAGGAGGPGGPSGRGSGEVGPSGRGSGEVGTTQGVWDMVAVPVRTPAAAAPFVDVLALAGPSVVGAGDPATAGTVSPTTR